MLYLKKKKNYTVKEIWVLFVPKFAMQVFLLSFSYLIQSLEMCDTAINFVCNFRAVHKAQMFLVNHFILFTLIILYSLFYILLADLGV